VKIEFGEGDGKVPIDVIAERAKKYQPKSKTTYKMIQEYVEKKYRFKVHTAYIAEVKRSLGLTMYDASNAVEELKHPRKHPSKVNYHICSTIWWILYVMKKYWDCIKRCVEGTSIHIRVVLNDILKHIEKCGEMKGNG
jgi:hypothetical protein